MKNLYKPTIYAKDIYSINYKKLKDHNIKYLLFDIDNTIANTNEKVPNKEVLSLFSKLKKEGFTIFILTNALPRRAKRFARILSTKTYYLSWKPLSINYKRIIKEYDLNKENIAAIGDQIYTDIKGANKIGITSILVNPTSNKESIFTKINRLKEIILIKRTKIIIRGEYYE